MLWVCKSPIIVLITADRHPLYLCMHGHLLLEPLTLNRESEVEEAVTLRNRVYLCHLSFNEWS